jgi:hypothetical protein
MGRMLRVLGLALMAIAVLAYLGTLYVEKGAARPAGPPDAAAAEPSGSANAVVWGAVFLAGLGLLVFGTYSMGREDTRRPDGSRRKKRGRVI